MSEKMKANKMKINNHYKNLLTFSKVNKILWYQSKAVSALIIMMLFNKLKKI